MDQQAWISGTAKVDQNEQCPKCDEARPDWLVWDDDSEMVTCSACGHHYAILQPIA